MAGLGHLAGVEDELIGILDNRASAWNHMVVSGVPYFGVLMIRILLFRVLY